VTGKGSCVTALPCRLVVAVLSVVEERVEVVVVVGVVAGVPAAITGIFIESVSRVIGFDRRS